MSRIDLSNLILRTDMVIDDSRYKHTDRYIDDIVVSNTYKDGNYTTISFKDITNYEDREKVGKVLEEELKRIYKLNNILEDDSVLVIGLGNRFSTPDSLGPKTIDNILITNHLFDIKKDISGMRRVSGISPGVKGCTGIDSATIIKSLVKETKPGFLIVIDALSSNNISRLNKTIQITDTGIHPGSGVGNNRPAITKENLSIPVIAIGVPTVTSSPVIVGDTIDYIFKHISYIKKHNDTYKLSYKKNNYRNILDNIDTLKEDNKYIFGLFGELDDNDKRRLIEEVLDETNLNMIVTPTEIDFLIDKLSNLISCSINNSLHRHITHY